MHSAAKGVWGIVAEVFESFQDRGVVPPDEDNWNKDLKELGVDSLCEIEIACALEERLDCTFEEEDLARVRTVRDLADLVSVATQLRGAHE